MFDELIAYTDWERTSWFDWFHEQGDATLATGIGPNGDGRFQTIGEVVRHIFSAEARYADRIANRPLTDSSVIPISLDALIAFAQTTRKSMNDLIATFEDWETARNFKIGNLEIHATPRKIVLHALMHEIRHWAQIGTILRLNGFKVAPHDLLISPI